MGNGGGVRGRTEISFICSLSAFSEIALCENKGGPGQWRGGDEVSSLGNLLDAPHDRMVSGNKDEPADAHLVDTLCKSEEEGESEEEDGNGVDGKPAYSRRGCPPCTARRQRRGGSCAHTEE